MQIVVEDRNENYKGIYLKDYYEDRDFLLATVSKKVTGKKLDKIVEKITKKVEKNEITFYGIFEKNAIINKKKKGIKNGL